MKALSWLKYFVYLLLFVLIIWLQGVTETAFQTGYQTTNKINYFLYIIVVLFPVFVGAIIGLETLVNEWSRKGKWKLNLPKLILISIPSCYVSMLYFISMANNQKLNDILIAPLLKFFGGSSAFVLIFQIVFGYSLMTLFFKKETATIVNEDIYTLEDNLTGGYSYEPVSSSETTPVDDIPDSEEASVEDVEENSNTEDSEK